MNKEHYPIATILGGGLSGLSFAYHYSGKSIIYEKRGKIGGTASTEVYDGFYFDHGPHVSFTNDPYITELLTHGVSFETKYAKPLNSYKKTQFKHPALFHLDELEANERYKILLDLVEAYKSFDGTHLPENFYDWCIRNQGKYFSEKYTIPYNKKFWQTDPKNMTTEWISNRIPVPSIKEAISSSLGLDTKHGYYYQKFRYPTNGGFSSFLNFWKTRQEKMQILINKEVTGINPFDRIIEFKDNSTAEYELLISTIPIPEMSNLVVDLPEEVKLSISKLKFTSLHYLNLAITGNWDRDMTWEYIYDNEIPISRIIPYNAMSNSMSPKNTTALQIEIPYTKEFDESLIEKSISYIQDRGYLDGRKILKTWHYDLKYGYVLYDKNRELYLNDILTALKDLKIYLLGRYGTWKYLWSHQAIEQGMTLAKEFEKKFSISKNTQEGV